MPINIPVIASPSGAKSTVTAPDPVVNTASPSPGLFFKIPDTSSSTKKVFGHLFGPFPISIDDVTPPQDYYAVQYLNPRGENNAHLAEGGFLRDRPKPRPPQLGDFQYKDAVSWVQTAKAVGLDGFFCNIMGGTGWYLDIYTKTRQAANAVAPGFYVIPMIDASGIPASTPAATVAGWIAAYSGLASTYRVNNVMMVGTFLTEGWALSVWQAVLTALQNNHGITAKFIAVYNNQSTAASYHSIQYATGQWGPGADPAIIPGWDPGVNAARARGEAALVPVWGQDIRPYAFWSEALNTGCLRAYWDKVIATNPEFVQVCTWSDFKEGSQFCPSAARGQAALDISAYYMARYKTGTFPTILVDALYLSYRNHVSGAPVRGPQTQFMTKRTHGGAESATRYAVEALVFLTAPASVVISVAGTETTFNAPAGMSSWIVSAAAGAVSARVIRSGQTVTAVSPSVPIRPDVWVEDRQYFEFGSLRGAVGQFDPMYTSSGNPPTYP